MNVVPLVPMVAIATVFAQTLRESMNAPVPLTTVLKGTEEPVSVSIANPWYLMINRNAHVQPLLTCPTLIWQVIGVCS